MDAYTRYTNEQNVLNSPFDIEVHKKTFINYLEIVILEDGMIEYAIPSHMLKVTDILAKQWNVTRRGVSDLCPPKYYFEYGEWLCRKAKTIMVWNNFFRGDPNDKQVETLVMLMREGLYMGNIDIDRFNRNKTYADRFGGI